MRRPEPGCRGGGEGGVAAESTDATPSQLAPIPGEHQLLAAAKRGGAAATAKACVPGRPPTWVDVKHGAVVGAHQRLGHQLHVARKHHKVDGTLQL